MIVDDELPSQSIDLHEVADGQLIRPKIDLIEDRFRHKDADYAYRVGLGLEEFHHGDESDNLNGQPNIVQQRPNV